MNISSLWGGNSGATDARNDAVRAEKNRQRLINMGMQQINAVYGGGTVPGWNMVQKGDVFDPNKQYYTSPNMDKYNPWNQPGNRAGFYGSHFQGMMGRNRPLYTKGEEQTYTGYGPDFYNKVTQDYINYALPQLAQQYKQASDMTTYGLAKRGLLNSSVADKSRSDLNLTMGRAKLNAADTGLQMSQQVRKQIEDQRQAAIQMLYQSATPYDTIKDTLAQAQGITIPSPIQPISNAFQNIMNQYAIQQLYPTGGAVTGQGYNPYYGLPSMRGSTPAAYY